MPRKRPDYRPILAEADRFEPRVERALLRASDRLRARVSINDLAIALSLKDARGALAMFASAAVMDALAPVDGILRDASARGKRLASVQVRALERR